MSVVGTRSFANIARENIHLSTDSLFYSVALQEDCFFRHFRVNGFWQKIARDLGNFRSGSVRARVVLAETYQFKQGANHDMSSVYISVSIELYIEFHTLNIGLRSDISRTVRSNNPRPLVHMSLTSPFHPRTLSINKAFEKRIESWDLFRDKSNEYQENNWW